MQRNETNSIAALKNFENVAWTLGNQKRFERFIKKASGSEDYEIVKSSKHRTVARIKDFYVKIFRHSNLIGKLKLRFHNMPRREWENARKLHNLTELTTEPIAYGESGNFSYFVSESLQPCEPFSVFIDKNLSQLSSKQKKQLSIRFLEFLGKLRESGFFQPDFHLDNILVKETAEGYRFYIVDLHRASFARAPLTFSRWAEQLTYILPCFEFLQYTDLRRFWVILKTRYPVMDEYFSRILEGSYARMRRHWCKKDRKLLTNSHKILHQKFQGYLKDEKIPEALRTDLLEEPENLFRFSTYTYKDSRSAKISIIEYQKKRYIFKRYNRRGLLHTLKYTLRKSRALTHWEKSIKFAARSLPTPEILAALEERKSGILKRSYILSELVGKGAENFEAHLQYLEINSPESLKHITLLLWEMHQRGIYHGDAKVSNFIYDPSVSKYRYFIIDLDGSRFKRSVNTLERLSDLVDLASSIEFLNLVKNPSEIIFNYYFSLGKIAHKNLRLKKKLFLRMVEKKLAHKRRRQAC